MSPGAGAAIPNQGDKSVAPTHPGLFPSPKPYAPGPSFPNPNIHVARVGYTFVGPKSEGSDHE